MIQKLKSMLAQNPRVIVGIDGMAAAGKSTLASKLASAFGGEVVRMDDFFLPTELRTEKRLSEAGGNVHYERFAKEVAAPLREHASFEYGVFDCSQFKITEKRHIKGNGLIIVEGAYTFRPEFRDLYDLKVFMSIDSETQLMRILQRSGAEKLEAFKEKWIPMEKKYFETYGIEAIADILLDGKA